MIRCPLTQCLCIAFVAAAAGAVHGWLRPITTWESSRANGQAQPLINRPDVLPQPPTTPDKPATPVPQPVSPQPTQSIVQTSDDRMVSLTRFKELLAGPLPAQVIDAREPREFITGRIPGAVNLPPSAFGGGMPDVVSTRLTRDLPVVVYCGGGDCDASKYVALRLKEFGFSQTFVYHDGYTGWTAAGEGVER